MKKVLLSGVAGAAVLMFASSAMAGSLVLKQGQKMMTNGGDVTVPAGSSVGPDNDLTATGGDAKGKQFQKMELDWGDGPLITATNSNDNNSNVDIDITIEPPLANKAYATKGGVANAGSGTINIDSWNTKQVNKTDLKAMNISSSVTNTAGNAGTGGAAYASNYSDQDNSASAKGGDASAYNDASQTAKGGLADASSEIGNIDLSAKGGDASAAASADAAADAYASASADADADADAAASASASASASAVVGNVSGSGTFADASASADADAAAAASAAADASAAAAASASADAAADAARGGDVDQHNDSDQKNVALADGGENTSDQDATADGGDAGNLQDNASKQKGTATGGNGGGSNQVFAWLGTGAVGAVNLTNVRGITNIAMSSGINVNQNISVSVNATASFN